MPGLPMTLDEALRDFGAEVGVTRLAFAYMPELVALLDEGSEKAPAPRPLKRGKRLK